MEALQSQLKKKSKKICPYCGLNGHVRRTHLSCLKHLINKSADKKNARDNTSTFPQGLTAVQNLQQPTLSTDNKTEEKFNIDEIEEFSEKTTYVVVSKPYESSQADSPLDGNTVFTQSSEMESATPPSQSAESNLEMGDDVTNQNSQIESSIQEDNIDWVQNIDVLDFDDDVDNLLEESDEDL